MTTNGPNQPITRPARIWLQPEDQADPATGPLWCEGPPVWEGATEYVRADLFNAALQLLRQTGEMLDSLDKVLERVITGDSQ